jgi:hypothetical protein
MSSLNNRLTAKFTILYIITSIVMVINPSCASAINHYSMQREEQILSNDHSASHNPVAEMPNGPPWK